MDSSESAVRIARALEDLQAHEARLASGRGAAPVELERYELGGILGEGAASVVYRARDRQLGRAVAVKVLREPLESGATIRERFQREAQVMAGLAHPNVVAVHDMGTSGGRFYLVLELVEGKPLKSLLSGGPSDVLGMARIISRAARGVAAAHAQGITHRDLKPANILLTQAGEPKVGDFGLAHVAGSSMELTRSGTILGTPAYMAPEQVRGRSGGIGPWTDVYALGAILYEAVTGHAPHQAETLTELFGKIAGEYPVAPAQLNPRVPRDLETVIVKAMEKEATLRYASAAEFADDLDRITAGEFIRARPPGLGRKSARWMRAHRGAVAAAGLVAVALAAWAGADAMGRLRSSREQEAVRQVQLGVASLDRGDEAGAVDHFTRALEFDPRYAAAYINRAEARRMLGDARQAASDIEKAIELDPRDAEAFNIRGRLRLDRDDLAGAEEDVSRAISLDPGHALAYTNRSGIRRELGRPREAIQDADQAIRLNPRMAEAWFNRGDARRMLGDDAGMIEDLERAKSMTPPDWPYRAEVDRMLADARRRLQSDH